MGIGSKYGIVAETGNNIQTDGLVFYVDAAYKKSATGQKVFNLASGSLTPTGSLKNDTELIGLPTASWAFGLDGIDDYIVFEEAGDSIIDAPKTLSFWYYTDDGTQVGMLISRTGNDFEVYQHTTGNALWTYWGSQTADDKLSIVTSTWTHVTYTIDESTSPPTQHAYQNGILTYSNQFGSSPSYANTNPLTLGVRASPITSYWDGKLANILMYNRALTSSDVLQNFNAQKDRFGL